MFEKYNINDLFLAHVQVEYPKNSWDYNIGGVIRGGISGYTYLTILRKIEEKYIDLQNGYKIITTEDQDSKQINYTIDYIEPLSKYYNQDGKRKNIFSRKKAISVAKKHYNEIHENYWNKFKEVEKIKSL